MELIAGDQILERRLARQRGDGTGTVPLLLLSDIIIISTDTSIMRLTNICMINNTR